jgi:hypothetical protein
MQAALPSPLQRAANAPEFIPGVPGGDLGPPATTVQSAKPAAKPAAAGKPAPEKKAAPAPAPAAKSWASMAAKAPPAPAPAPTPVPEKPKAAEPPAAKQSVKSKATDTAPTAAPTSAAAAAAMPPPKPAAAAPPGPPPPISPALAAKRPAPVALPKVDLPPREIIIPKSKYDLKALLERKAHATILTQLLDFKRVLQENPELDPEKDMPARSQDASTPRSGRRGDGQPGTPKSGRGKNNKDAPLRDRTGKIIEVQALEMSENRWKPSKPTESEAVVFKAVKGVLNKLTLEKFEKLYGDILECGINNASLLRGFVVILYDKAVLEPTFIGMYAKMCEKLARDLPECSDEMGVLSFKEVLIGKCRSEFENMGQLPEGSEDLSKEDKEQAQRKARQRNMGNVEFIGELFKLSMVTVQEVYNFAEKLLVLAQDESDAIQPLCKLLEGVGLLVEKQDKPKMDSYFEEMDKLAEDEKLSSRFKFMLLDLKDLRANNWKPRNAKEGPKLMDEVKKEVDKENRFTEKKKTDKDAEKAKEKKEREKKERKKNEKKAKEAVEDDGWSQVGTVVPKSKGKGKKQQQQEAPLSPTRALAPGTPQKVSKGIASTSGGFAALMGSDGSGSEDSSDDDDEDDDDDDESEEEQEQAEKSKMLLNEEGEAKVGSILEEYLCIHDKEEAVECVLELHEKFPVHEVNQEVVRRGLLMAMDAGDKEAMLMGNMFAELIDRKVMEPGDGSAGMCSVMADLPDIAIDIPHAPSLMASIMHTMLDSELLTKPPIVEALKVRCVASSSLCPCIGDACTYMD